MKHQTVTSYDGTRLHTSLIDAITDRTAGTIYWVHGAFEHSGRYTEAMEWFAAQGYQSIIWDHRGHGKSSGKRCYVNSMNDYLKDYIAVYEAYKPECQQPVYSIAHSMGGLILIRLLQKYADKVPLDKALVSSPFLGVKVAIPAWKTILSKIVTKIYPALSMPNELIIDHLTHEKSILDTLKTDSLRIDIATAGWFEVMLENHALALTESNKIHTPLYFFLAGDDKIVDVECSKALYKALPDTLSKSMKIYDGLYHEILNETSRLEVYNDILAKLKS